jgi:hypothetical protein
VQVMNAFGAAFIFTSPTGLGRNAFYWEDFADGIADAMELEVCFEKSGGVTSIQYKVKKSSLAMLDIQTTFQPISNTMEADHIFGHLASDMGTSQTGPTPFLSAPSRSSSDIHSSAYISEEPSFVPSDDLAIKTMSSATVSIITPGASPSVLSSEKMSPASNPTTSAIQRPIEACQSPSKPPSALPVDGTMWMSPSPFHKEKAERIECDFSSLDPGDFVTASLRKACLIEITAFSLDGAQGDYSQGGPAQVFDSSNPTKGSNQLGSPNQDCPNAGPGGGTGGSPLHQANQAYQNCKTHGNLLIVPQGNEDAHPIPAARGGCINFHFVVPVILEGAGVLDIPPGTTVMYTVRVGVSKMKCVLFCSMPFP